MPGDDIGRLGEPLLHVADRLRIGRQVAIRDKADIAGLYALNQTAAIKDPVLAKPDDDIVVRMPLTGIIGPDGVPSDGKSSIPIKKEFGPWFSILPGKR